MINEQELYDAASRACPDVGWRASLYLSRESQLLTYAAASQFTPCLPATLLDAGCNQGDFLRYGRNKRCVAKYHGIDTCVPAIEIAKARYGGDPDATFEVKSILQEEGQYDWVIALGPFNFAQPGSQMTFLGDHVHHLWKRAVCGMSFTVLTDSCPEEKRAEGLYYYNPTEVLDLVRLFTRRFRLLHHYHDVEMCFHLLR